MYSLDNIQIVLVEISHPGNLGAAARAMKTMGLSHLRLVQPKQFPSAEATARATGADDVLSNAQLFDTLEESLRDCHIIFATSARLRAIAWPVISPKTCAEQALKCTGKVAIVFGREQAGLTNQELDYCNYLVQIPTNPTFRSLNVASAVQILAYELREKYEQLIIRNDELIIKNDHSTIDETDFSLPPPAIAEDVTRFYEHLEQTLIHIGFLDPQKPRHLLRHLHRLFNRIQLLDSEVRLLRGILTAIQKKVPQSALDKESK